MLVRMAKVRIVVLRGDLECALALIHRLGTLDPSVSEAPGALPVGALHGARIDVARIARIDGLLERAASLLGTAALVGVHVGPVGTEAGTADELAGRLADVLAGAEPIAQPLVGRRAALEAELAVLRRHEHAIRRILPLPSELLDLEGSEATALVMQPGYEAALEALRGELDRRTQGLCETVSALTEDGGVAVLLVYSRRHAPAVHDLLRGEHLSEVHLPESLRGRPLRDALAAVRERLGQIPLEVAAVEADLCDALRRDGPRVAALRRALADAKDELALVARCVESDRALVLTGWMPARDVDPLERSLATALEGRVLVERIPIGRKEAEEMPVLLENVWPIRPFEVLLSLFPAPRYGSVDPTPFLAFFFPLFFGLILADVGYGLIVVGLGTWLQTLTARPAAVRQAGQVLAAAGTSAVVFGIAFGELFGDLGRTFGMPTLIADRGTAIPALLAFCVALGATQVVLGLLLGVLNGVLLRHRKEAVSRAGVLLGLLGIFVFVGVLADILPERGLAPGTILVALALVALLYAAGPIGPLEVIGAFGNVLSYVRIAAVGLASAFLADIANELAGRTGSLVVGLIVGGLLHALNLALGLVGPTLQGLRLQYVEFFGRFFEPGGRPYHPFRISDQ